MSILNAPAKRAVSITPSDTVNLSDVTRGIYVGGAGDISLVIAGTTVLFSGAAAGSVLPIHASRVNSTNTTATNLVALY